MTKRDNDDLEPSRQLNVDSTSATRLRSARPSMPAVETTATSLQSVQSTCLASQARLSTRFRRRIMKATRRTSASCKRCSRIITSTHFLLSVVLISILAPFVYWLRVDWLPNFPNYKPSDGELRRAVAAVQSPPRMLTNESAILFAAAHFNVDETQLHELVDCVNRAVCVLLGEEGTGKGRLTRAMSLKYPNQTFVLPVAKQADLIVQQLAQLLNTTLSASSQLEAQLKKLLSVLWYAAEEINRQNRVRNSYSQPILLVIEHGERLAKDNSDLFDCLLRFAAETQHQHLLRVLISGVPRREFVEHLCRHHSNTHIIVLELPKMSVEEARESLLTAGLSVSLIERLLPIVDRVHRALQHVFHAFRQQKLEEHIDSLLMSARKDLHNSHIDLRVNATTIRPLLLFSELLDRPNHTMSVQEACLRLGHKWDSITEACAAQLLPWLDHSVVSLRPSPHLPLCRQRASVMIRAWQHIVLCSQPIVYLLEQAVGKYGSIQRQAITDQMKQVVADMEVSKQHTQTLETTQHNLHHHLIQLTHN